MENKFDEKIAKMLNEEIYIPQKITNRIKTSLKEERKGVWLGVKLNKIVGTMVGIILIGTGAVFATKAYIESRKSVDIARDYEYFEKVDTEYISHAGLGIKIEDYFIDQGRVGVTIDIQSNEEIDSAEIYSTDITETNTYSETINGTTYIHWDESEIGLEYNRRVDLIKFMDENGNEIRYKEDSIGGIGPELGEYKKVGENVVRTMYTMPVYEDITASKMKVVIKRVVTHKDGNEKEYIGNWEFEINIADKYRKESKSMKYNGKVNLENVIVERAELSATKLIVTVKVDDLKKLLYRPEDNKELYGGVKLFGEEGEYKQEEVNGEQSNYYDKNEITFKFDISKFNAENLYKIIMPAIQEGASEIVIMLNK